MMTIPRMKNLLDISNIISYMQSMIVVWMYYFVYIDDIFETLNSFMLRINIFSISM
jgi:hypothetical protein